MCVGLGGPIKLTERGDQIKSCVHGEGKAVDASGKLITAGFVETELVHSHPDPVPGPHPHPSRYRRDGAGAQPP